MTTLCEAESAWYHVRRLSSGDLEACLELESRVTDSGWSSPELRSEFDSPRHRLRLGVFDQNETLRAHFFLRVLCPDIEVLHLCVDPISRREGLAKLLFSSMLLDEVTENAKTIYLEVARLNTPARLLYERLGFSAQGMRRGYYRGDIDAVNMSASVRDLRKRLEPFRETFDQITQKRYYPHSNQHSSTREFEPHSSNN